MYQLSTQFQGNITKVVHIFVFITMIKIMYVNLKGVALFLRSCSLHKAYIHNGSCALVTSINKIATPGIYLSKSLQNHNYTFNEMAEEQSIHVQIQSFLSFFLCIAYK